MSVRPVPSSGGWVAKYAARPAITPSYEVRSSGPSSNSSSNGANAGLAFASQSSSSSSSAITRFGVPSVSAASQSAAGVPSRIAATVGKRSAKASSVRSVSGTPHRVSTYPRASAIGARVHLLAVPVDERVEDLVDQAHRHELAGLGVHRLGEAPRCARRSGG